MNPLMWVVSLLIAGVLAWLLLQYFPFRFTMPERLLAPGVGFDPVLSAEAFEANKTVNYWNLMVDFALAGAVFGLLPVLLNVSGGQRLAAGILAGLVVGGGIGLVAFLVNHQTVEFWGLNDSARADVEPSMYADLSIVAITSGLLGLATGVVMFVRPVPDRGQKLIVILLAGLLVGIALPLLATFVFPEQPTTVIPPTDAAFRALWLGLLLGFIGLLTSMTGDRSATTKPS